MTHQESPTCISVRRSLLSDPLQPDVQQHLQHCDQCRAFAHELALFDADIKNSMNIAVPDGLANKILLAKGVKENNQKLKINKRFKSAAIGIALVFSSIASFIFLSTPLMIEEIAIAHVKDERHHLEDKNNIKLAQLNEVLSPFKMQLHQTSHTINYAGSCQIRKHKGVHVVLQGEHSPVTLLFMPGEHVDSRKRLEDSGFKGVVIPVENGSVAIISDKNENLADYEKQIIQQLVFI